MSESSLPLPDVSTPAAGRPALTGVALLDSLTPLLTEWLHRQRWFAGKDRPITGFTLVAATEMLPTRQPGGAPGLVHLLVRVRQPAPHGENEHGTASDCYQLLLGVRSVPPPELSAAAIGRPTTGPLRGHTVYDALHDRRLTGLLLHRLRSPGRLGALHFSCAPGASVPSGLPSRLLEAEQSNSSVVYGSAYILKLFRRVGPGVNPDLELPLALAHDGCRRVPAPTAWFETPGRTAGSSLTLGVLQPYLPGSVDGWQLALHTLGSRGDFTGAARELGRTTAEVHASLAHSLPTTVLQRSQLENLAAGMTERLDEAAGVVPALRPYRSGLRGAFAAVADLARHGRSRRAQRVHGDLHLGQALRTHSDGRWYLIDFEGEPARPLAERRRPQPAVRDVAGMLRSFDYAACQHGPAHTWCGEWARANRAAYCAGYADVAGTDPREDGPLLRAFETDKAIYEVLYEARHRPAWLPIPMSAVRRLAAADM
jgi:maltokinase